MAQFTDKARRQKGIFQTGRCKYRPDTLDENIPVFDAHLKDSLSSAQALWLPCF